MTQERVRNSRGKLAIRDRAKEVLLYLKGMSHILTMVTFWVSNFVIFCFFALLSTKGQLLKKRLCTIEANSFF